MAKASKMKKDKTPVTARSAAAERVAVIDVGTDSIRMAIAEICPDGRIHTLESLSQAVHLGSDTFTQGSIKRKTVEECVKVLESFERKLKEYGISRPEQIRAVATSAVREASNREAVLDRICVATGIRIEVIDVAEVTRLTYLSVYPYLKADPKLTNSGTLILEVGGGSTELLLLQKGNVAYHNTYRLGSLRMREMLEAQRAPLPRLIEIMKSHIQRAIDQILPNVPSNAVQKMIVVGGDARFAVSRLSDDTDHDKLSKLSVAELTKFTRSILDLTVEELVEAYHLTFSEAETLGPALLAYAQIARALNLSNLLVSDRSLRDGLLAELSAQGSWTEEFKGQIIKSAMDLGRKFHFDEKHAQHVAELSIQIFDAMQDRHSMTPRHRLLLRIAGLLHEIGLFVSERSHHKHSMYLIQNSELFGLGRKDLALVSLLARYHRRATPKPSHAVYSSLDRDGKIEVAKLAAILRVADALERGHAQRISKIKFLVEDDRFIITVPHVEDLTLEQFAMQQKGDLFEQVYGLRVVLRKQGAKRP